MKKALFPNAMDDSTVNKYMGIMVDSLWYVDSCMEKLKNRTLTISGQLSYTFPERYILNMSRDIRKPGIEIPTRSDTNRAVHRQNIA